MKNNQHEILFLSPLISRCLICGVLAAFYFYFRFLQSTALLLDYYSHPTAQIYLVTPDKINLSNKFNFSVQQSFSTISCGSCPFCIYKNIWRLRKSINELQVYVQLGVSKWLTFVQNDHNKI